MKYLKIVSVVILSSLAIVAVVFVPTVVQATPFTYAIYFDSGLGPFRHADWSGTFTLDNGVVTNFIAVDIETLNLSGPSPLRCSEVAKCTFSAATLGFGTSQIIIRTVGFPAAPGEPAIQTADLILFGGLASGGGGYFIHTPIAPGGFGQDRDGVYLISQFPIAEPSALLLLSAGIFTVRRKFLKLFRGE